MSGSGHGGGVGGGHNSVKEHLSKLLHIFVQFVACICQGCYMYLSKLLNVFVKWPMVVVEVGIIL